MNELIYTTNSTKGAPYENFKNKEKINIVVFNGAKFSAL